MIKYKKTVVTTIAGGLASLPSAMAHCPICTAATGVAVGVARFYGVDDAIVGVLIGGFIVSTAFWIDKVLKRKSWNFFYGQSIALILLSLISTIISFKVGNLFTNNAKLLFAVPRLLSGMLIGTAVTSGGEGLNVYLRQLNDGKNFVAFQGISIMLTILVAVVALFSGGLL